MLSSVCLLSVLSAVGPHSLAAVTSTSTRRGELRRSCRESMQTATLDGVGLTGYLFITIRSGGSKRSRLLLFPVGGGPLQLELRGRLGGLENPRQRPRPDLPVSSPLYPASSEPEQQQHTHRGAVVGAALNACIM